MAESGIYEIVNLVNGKRYVGSALDFDARWRDHRYRLRHGKHHSSALQRAWRKYGETSFAFRSIHRCEPSELLIAEQSAIDELRPEYNCCKVAGRCTGRPVSATTREKMRAAKSGKSLSAEHRAKISASLKGKTLTPEQNLALQAAKSAACKGRPLSTEHRAKIRATHRGRKWPAEQGRKISAAKTGKPRPDMIGNKWGCKRP